MVGGGVVGGGVVGGAVVGGGVVWCGGRWCVVGGGVMCGVWCVVGAVHACVRLSVRVQVPVARALGWRVRHRLVAAPGEALVRRVTRAGVLAVHGEAELHRAPRREVRRAHPALDRRLHGDARVRQPRPRLAAELHALSLLPRPYAAAVARDEAREREAGPQALLLARRLEGAEQQLPHQRRHLVALLQLRVAQAQHALRHLVLVELVQEQEQALLRRRRQRHRLELRPPRHAARQPCAQLLARAGREAAHLGLVYQHWRGGEACQQLGHEVVRRIAALPHQTLHVRLVRRARQRLTLLGLLPPLLRPLLHPQRPGYKEHGDGGEERNNLDDNIGWLFEYHLHSGLGPRLRSARRDGLVRHAEIVRNSAIVGEFLRGVRGLQTSLDFTPLAGIPSQPLR